MTGLYGAKVYLNATALLLFKSHFRIVHSKNLSQRISTLQKQSTAVWYKKKVKNPDNLFKLSI